MSLYKFRVSYEEDENIFRDVEIKPNQSLKDLNDIIVDAFKLPQDRTCRIFKSNDNWQKLQELDLNPTPVKKNKQVLVPMIISFVDDPHQKFLYEFEAPKQDFNLFIELILIGTEKAGGKYPVITKSSGPSPVKKDDLLIHLTKKSVAEEEEYGIEQGEENDLEGMGEEGEVGTEEKEAEEGGEDETESAFGDDFAFGEGGEDFKDE